MTVEEKTAEKAEQDHLEYMQCQTGVRQFEIIKIYFYVVGGVSLAWFLGYMNMSFAWNIVIFLLLFIVWKGKLLKFTRDVFLHSFHLAHRKRSFRGKESMEWFNLIVNRWWIFSSQSLFDRMKYRIDYRLQQWKPAFLNSIELSSITFGTDTPHIYHVRSFDCIDGPQHEGEGECGAAPQILHKASEHKVALELDMGLVSNDLKMVFTARMKHGIPVSITVEQLKLSGRIHMMVYLDMSAPFPHVGRITASFMDKPDFSFAMNLSEGITLTDIPLLKEWVYNLAMDAISHSLVDPGKMNLYTSDGSSNRPLAIGDNKIALGVLTVTIYLPPLMGLSDVVSAINICTVKLGNQRYVSKDISCNSACQETFSFLVYSMQDKLVIKLKSKSIVGMYPLAEFEFGLHDHPLLLEPVVEIEQKSGNIPIKLQMEYTKLTPIDFDDGEMESRNVYSVSGVMTVRIHCANSLMALDRSGTSDPYCILYACRRKITKTHYVPNTCNPKWDVISEFFVADYTKAPLTFVLYDWDGHDVGEDDFLGTAQLSLSEEEAAIFYKTLYLTYTSKNKNSATAKKFGCLIVSAIFRPVNSVSKSETSQGASLSQDDIIDFQGHNFQQQGDSMGVGAMLSKGLGVVDLHIIEGRNLVAADIGGTSDPFCKVKIGKETVFKSKVVSKTLNPQWNEHVTTRMPQEAENIEFIVYDKDTIGKDFLGRLVLTGDDLRKLSRKGESQWHKLIKIKRGEIHLGCRIITDNRERSVSSIDASPTPVFLQNSPDLNNSVSETPTSSRLEATPLPGDIVDGKKDRRRTVGKGKKQGEGVMTVEAMLANGIPVMNLHVVEGRNLVAADFTGSSDPYCKVKVGGTVLKTKTIKKTLNPQWNEHLNLRMPTKWETMDIIVYDYDTVGKDDFIGKIQVSHDVVMKLANQGVPQWFQLKEVKHGELLLGCKVINASRERPASAMDAAPTPPVVPHRTASLKVPVTERPLKGDTAAPPPYTPTLPPALPEHKADNGTRRVKSVSSDRRDGRPNELGENSSVASSVTTLQMRSAGKPSSSIVSGDTGETVVLRGDLVGQLVAIRGKLLSTVKGDIYIKIKLEGSASQAGDQRTLRTQDMFRSQAFRNSHTSTLMYLLNDFKITSKEGFTKDSTLTFIMKSTHRKEVLAQRNFVVFPLLKGDKRSSTFEMAPSTENASWYRLSSTIDLCLKIELEESSKTFSKKRSTSLRGLRQK